MAEPVFAVVGHPNKGKSSIVATLAHDDSVRIAPRPGTTVRCRHYPMTIDGQLMYTVVDTPGFQRARRALAWMKQHETSSDRHLDVVKTFVETHRPVDQFVDECELLGPVIEGAGILYVVDGSRPYGEEYEAEMEILRWTGQPSMGLINPIGGEDHIDQWKAALAQHFKIVRVFNAMTAPFHKRLDLLRAFGQLREEWRHPLSQAVDSLETDRARRHSLAARTVAEMIADMLCLTVTKALTSEADPEPHKPALTQRYQDELRRRERQGREAVEQIHDLRKLERDEGDVVLIDDDLFKQSQWYLWGLNRKQLVAAGAAGGGVTGGLIDAGLGGSTFLVGTAIGVAIGSTLAWLGADRLAKFEILKLPLGGKQLQFGPTTNINFPYVTLGRALAHYDLVARRTHARRDVMRLHEETRPSWIDRLSTEQRRALETCFRRIRRNAPPPPEEVCDDLTELIEALIADADVQEVT